MKKLILTVLVFSVFIINLNSLDSSDVYVVYLGHTIREEFNLKGDNISAMRILFEAGRSGFGYRTDKFFRITSQKEDAEDREMINFVFNRSGKLPSARSITTDNTYLVMVFRTDNPRTGFVDGWYIMTQPNTNGTWSYYLYYFSQLR